jgi:hypothetical protein
MMKHKVLRYSWLLPFIIIMTACASPLVSATKEPTEAAFERTKLFAITAETETQISGYPNDASATAILATKFALNTEAVLTETALPTETPTPLVPPHTPPCRPSGLKAIPYGSMGAAGTIALGGGVINISASACYLQAWPVFSLVDAAGKTLDIQSEQGDEGSGNILLSPGQSVGFMFAWGNWCGGEVVGGVSIRIFLPDQSGLIDIPPGGLNSPVYGGGYCGNPGSKSFIYSISSFEYETNQPTPSTTTIPTIEYRNTEYGFSFSLPASWKGYSIITDTWRGYNNSDSEITVEQGPMISIRHPQWTSENPRQDIPIWVFTVAQWNSLQQGNYSVSAGGIYTELGRNARYVFALYSRYNYVFLTGFEEVQTILEGNPLHTP